MASMEKTFVQSLRLDPITQESLCQWYEAEFGRSPTGVAEVTRAFIEVNTLGLPGPQTYKEAIDLLVKRKIFKGQVKRQRRKNRSKKTLAQLAAEHGAAAIEEEN